MPYIPTTITHKASGAIYAYKQSVSGGAAAPDGVKTITAGYGIGGGGNTGAVALTNEGIVTITAGAGVAVTTSGDTTTLTATASGAATSGTSVRYATNLTSPFTFLPNASTILCTLETPTTNNYAEVAVGFVPAQTNPYVAPVIAPTAGTQLGIYLSPAPVLTPTIISNCYGAMIAETSTISNIPFTLPDITGQSTYPTNALYLSAVSPTPVSTWYVVASNYAGSVPYISGSTCQQIRCSLYANNIVTT